MQSNLDKDLFIFSYSDQGERAKMEDFYDISFQKNLSFENKINRNNILDYSIGINYVYLAVFDGHGGKEAAEYCKAYLLKNIVDEKDFWSLDDQLILKAIRRGFWKTHIDMEREVDSWPKTLSGHRSTAGTTGSVCFIMNNKYYIGHVGDSRIVLSRSFGKNYCSNKTINLTEDHKPECPIENERIEKAGGKVLCKSGTQRVVWKRSRVINISDNPKVIYDEIPFLAIARSLGDLWSYNKETDTYIISPEPHVLVQPIMPSDRFLILASDGIWNVCSSEQAVKIVSHFVRRNDILNRSLSPAHDLVRQCLSSWHCRSDNTTAIVVFIGKPPFCDIPIEAQEIHSQNIILTDNIDINEYSPINNPKQLSSLPKDCHLFCIESDKNIENESELKTQMLSLSPSIHNKFESISSESFEFQDNAFRCFTNIRYIETRTSLPESFYNSDQLQTPLQTINNFNCKKDETISDNNELSHRRRSNSQNVNINNNTQDNSSVTKNKIIDENQINSNTSNEDNKKSMKRKRTTSNSFSKYSPVFKRLRSSNWSRSSTNSTNTPIRSRLRAKCSQSKTQ